MAEKWRTGFQPDQDATGFLDRILLTGASIPVTTDEAVAESKSQMIKVVNGQPVARTTGPTNEHTVQIVRLPEEPISGQSLIEGVAADLTTGRFQIHTDHVKAGIAASGNPSRIPLVQIARTLEHARQIMSSTIVPRTPLNIAEQAQHRQREAGLALHVYIGLKKLNGK